MKNELYSADDFVKILISKFNNDESVQLKITGNSMVPLFVHKRDTVILTPVTDEIKKGDIIFYRRKNGKCVLHRVNKVTNEGLYFVGDSQTEIEGPLDRSCALAICKAAIRKDRYINEKSLIWKFFRYIWIKIIPLRLRIIRFISKIKN